MKTGIKLCVCDTQEHYKGVEGIWYEFDLFGTIEEMKEFIQNEWDSKLGEEADLIIIDWEEIPRYFRANNFEEIATYITIIENHPEVLDWDTNPERCVSLFNQLCEDSAYDDTLYDYDAIMDFVSSMSAIEAFHLGNRSELRLSCEYYTFDGNGNIESVSIHHLNEHMCDLFSLLNEKYS